MKIQHVYRCIFNWLNMMTWTTGLTMTGLSLKDGSYAFI